MEILFVTPETVLSSCPDETASFISKSKHDTRISKGPELTGDTAPIIFRGSYPGKVVPTHNRRTAPRLKNFCFEDEFARS